MTLSFAASPMPKPKRPRRMSKNVCVKFPIGPVACPSIVKLELVNLMGTVSDAMTLKLYYKSRMSTVEVAKVLNCTEAEVWNVLARNDKEKPNK